MEYRKIGSLKVSSVGMGCMGLSHASGAPLEKKQAVRYWTAAPKRSADLLRAALGVLVRIISTCIISIG